ncbi:MAG: hypothetical protein AB1782_19170 [Cyanobacteriota bacterium]
MEKTFNSKKEEIIIAAIMYLSIIIPFLGLFIPFSLWLIYKEKSTYVTFHSLQNILYQFSGLILFFLGMTLYAGSFFITIIAIIGSSAANSSNEPDPLFFVFFCIPFLIFILILFCSFLYIIYAIIGCFSVLIEKDFKFIIIGNLLEKYLSSPDKTTNNMNSTC